MSIEAVALHICSKRAALIIWWWPVWPFQPDLNNEVFDDTDGREGAGEGLTGKVSPRQPLLSDRREYMSFAAVPRRSTPSMDLQVPTASNTARASLCLAWPVVGSVLLQVGDNYATSVRNWERQLFDVMQLNGAG